MVGAAPTSIHDLCEIAIRVTSDPLEEGYPIGSGTVESGVKQFKGRLTGPGMRWTRRAAEKMLVIRGAVMGQNFDALWDAA